MVARESQSSYSYRKIGFSRYFIIFGLSAYLVSSCFYVFRSGVPQPADYLLVVVMFAAMTMSVIGLGQIRYIALPSCLMLAYCWMVSSVYYFLYLDAFFLASPLFYSYNVVAMFLVACVIIVAPREACRYISISAIAILVIQFGAVSIDYRLFGERHTGTLNDPNQLGYMVLLALYAKLVTKPSMRLEASDVLCLAISGYVILKTMSRSATVGWVAMFFVATIFLKASLQMRAVLIAAFSVGLVVVGMYEVDFTAIIFENTLVSNMTERFQEKGHDDSLSARGYDRLWLYPEYLLLGAGEGAPERFGSAGEIHSTWANVLFSYGIIGFSLFIWLLVRVFRYAHVFHILLFLGPAGYGVSTYGLRTTLFWVVLGMVFGLSQLRLSAFRNTLPE